MNGKQVAVVVAALLLALLLGVAVASANDLTLWKQHCPAYADVILLKADDWGGVHVLCVLGDREEVTPVNNR